MCQFFSEGWSWKLSKIFCRFFLSSKSSSIGKVNIRNKIGKDSSDFSNVRFPTKNDSVDGWNDVHEQEIIVIAAVEDFEEHVNIPNSISLRNQISLSTDFQRIEFLEFLHGLLGN